MDYETQRKILYICQSSIQSGMDGDEPCANDDLVEIVDLLLGGDPTIRDWMRDRITDREVIEYIQKL